MKVLKFIAILNFGFFPLIISAHEEEILFLQKYIQSNTSHPNLSYEEVIQLFTNQAKSDGFTTQVLTLPHKGKALLILYSGKTSRKN